MRAGDVDEKRQVRILHHRHGDVARRKRWKVVWPRIGKRVCAVWNSPELYGALGRQILGFHVRILP